MKLPTFHATTVIAVQHNNQVAIGADGQATLGNTVAKSSVNKIYTLQDGKIIVGMAGNVVAGQTLVDRLDNELNTHKKISHAAVSLLKKCFIDKNLPPLEAMLIAISAEEMVLIAGSGEVITPDNGIAAIGSGSMYGQAAALALKTHAPHLTAEEIVHKALLIAADICIYTNTNITVRSLACGTAR